MAAYALLRGVVKSETNHSSLFLHITRGYFTFNTKTLPTHHFQARSLATDANAVSLFDRMTAGNHRKYYMLGGKGGVGKTSCAASLAVKFASYGHPTILVSTDPAHSLSDSFDQVMQFVDSPEYSMFTRIVFDTASTVINSFKYPTNFKSGSWLCHPNTCFLQGHTLRLLSLPDFMDASIGKIMKMKKKIASATSAIKSVFGKQQPSLMEGPTDKLEELRERMAKVRDLFRDPETTEFVIVTIPTVMAVRESSRLHASLKKENVPVKRLIVNQILSPSATDCRFCSMKRKDQMGALDMIRSDPELGSLVLTEAPLVDVEIRGVPALQFMGNMVWK